ncbi:hypothetical protein VSX64_10615 [Aurantimonas sp. C2-6-R+9]|uniref:hypothetical protein n=1 Tax=unclassified Aurantimonas TaxID=2638230 RepID=UPI002E176A8A|nr:MULTISPECIES: hypothetical protein [unclassified Aurantimonas]MEC5291001.1 hypothetical protein [Aurantimonas sp. C2-3-R2]MEC5323432.1 hypothetical protein [Aurantimonas sp. A3-2-R12]MEC5381330.1 hypothetical protein [Aurantimonas sp. C2-6-R+9]MEC5412152.1 hypothetical protein [Aurantimonas sp. C2-4-R8]
MDTMLAKAVDRLETALATETDALSAGKALDLMEITARKNQSLLELSRLARRAEALQEDPDARERLTGLAKVIEQNRRALELHVRASHEISALIARSITDAESDGTYSLQLGRKAVRS